MPWEVTGAVNLPRSSEGLPLPNPTRLLYQGDLHQADRRLFGARTAAEHDPGAELQHHRAAQLVGVGSRQVSRSIGATLGNGGYRRWSISAKGR